MTITLKQKPRQPHGSVSCMPSPGHVPDPSLRWGIQFDHTPLSWALPAVMGVTCSIHPTDGTLLDPMGGRSHFGDLSRNQANSRKATPDRSFLASRDLPGLTQISSITREHITSTKKSSSASFPQLKTKGKAFPGAT